MTDATPFAVCPSAVCFNPPNPGVLFCSNRMRTSWIGGLFVGLVCLGVPLRGWPDQQTSGETTKAAKATKPDNAGDKDTPPAKHRKLTLPELIATARHYYPGVLAAKHGIEAMQMKLAQARWAWAPRGVVNGLFAPTPRIQCRTYAMQDGGLVLTENPDGPFSASEACINTETVDFSLEFSGVMARIVLELVQPLYTFDKISSAKRAAKAGVALKQAELDAAAQSLVLNVTRAYWGIKAAKEMLYTIDSGQKHLDKAMKRLEKDLDEGTGEATMTDLLRLRTAKAEIDARRLEGVRLQQIARASLATLTGIGPKALEVDDEVIAAQDPELKPLRRYLSLAKQSRPESKMLNAAILASEAKVDLERAKLFPDFVLVGTLGIGRATNIDDPKNGFLNDPFNFTRTGLALGLRWNLNTAEQIHRLKEASAERRQAAAKRREALAGIELEVQKAYAELSEAHGRLTSMRGGSKAAKSWLMAASQNLAAGLAEVKELNDALVAFFKMQLLYLKAVYDVNVGRVQLARAVGLSRNTTPAPTENHARTDVGIETSSR